MGQQGPATDILALQPFSLVTSMPIDGAADTAGEAYLYNLNPRINRWYVLRLEWGVGQPVMVHLENPAPRHQVIALDEESRRGLIVRLDLNAFPCELWSKSTTSALDQARATRSNYSPICDGRIYVRNKSTGYRTTRELVVDFLRDRVWGGEKVITLTKSLLFRDQYLERADLRKVVGGRRISSLGPRNALVNPDMTEAQAVPRGLGIEIDTPTPGSMDFGGWYPVRNLPGIHVSVLRPGDVDAPLLRSHEDRVRPLDEVEAQALVYLIAFDLGRYEFGFETGTDHPRVGWSERSAIKQPELAGPDGFNSSEPLVRTGIVNPIHIPRTVATFTGGFKRSHGAFRYGQLAEQNRSSHYGWIQSGVVFSTLQPGLATLLVLDSGDIAMKTWTADDQPLLRSIRHARQNGVPIIERDTSSGRSIPGALVGNWRAGNWSGSASGQLRTVRGGACLQDTTSGRFLIYAYFSSVTPSAMARVFQAYECQFAMLLDMNALEHTYAAVYHVQQSNVGVQHLVKGMEEVDRKVGELTVPRFIGYPDSRDFFYIMHRSEERL